MRRLSPFNITSMTLGFAFLYIPIILLVVYSFNAGKSVAVWAGWSTKWYGSVFQNEQLMDAAWVTLRVAFLTASVATVLGTLAAIVLTLLTKQSAPVHLIRRSESCVTRRATSSRWRAI